MRIALEILIPKILNQPVEIEPRLGGSWPAVVGSTANLLQALSVTHITHPLDGVIVIVDANGSPRGQREGRLRDKVGNRQFRFGVPIYHAIVRQLETWLISDPDAINAAAGVRIPIVQDPETFHDPKRHLIQILKNARASSYNRQFVRTAAEAADIAHMQRRCAGFAEFVAKLQGLRR